MPSLLPMHEGSLALRQFVAGRVRAPVKRRAELVEDPERFVGPLLQTSFI